MNRIILFFSVALFLSGCVSTIEKKQKYTEIAEKAKQTENSLPLGFKFNMSKVQVGSVLDNLLKSDKISKEEEDYYYDYIIGDKREKCNLDFEFYQDKLYKLTFYFEIDFFSKNGKKRMKELYDQLSAEYEKSGFEKIYDKIDNNSFLSHWFKKNKIIILGAGVSYYLSFKNAPISKIVSDAKFKVEKIKLNRLVNEALERGEKQKGKPKIINSPWDSSVTQVQSYLKKNLKDPKSYESIEWSKVNNSKDGYWVRHKYRAKNSLGGFAIENKIFYMNFDGVVTKVVDYK